MATFKNFHRILFSIEFVLNGYKDDVTQHIQLLPDAETLALLSKYRITLRKCKNSYVALIEVGSGITDLEQPKIEIAQDEVFRFQVKIRDHDFFSRIHLYEYDLQYDMLQLSNAANHIEGTAILLSKPIPAYSSGHHYKVGYLVKAGTDYYRAIQPSTAADPHPVTDVTHWKGIPNGSFANQADIVLRPPTIDLNSFMVIDIVHSSALPTSYQLLDAALKCKEIAYKIILLNK